MNEFADQEITETKTKQVTAEDYSCSSIQGPVRSENQDSACVFSFGSSIVLIVADGMGGHASGREAAEIVVASCAEAVYRRILSEDWDTVLQKGISTAQEQVLAAARRQGGNGMGATVVFAIVDISSSPPLLHWAHVGDSRAYLCRGLSLYQLTADHSWVGQMIREGHLTEEDAFSHPDSNIIQRAIGQEGPLEAEVHPAMWMDRGDTLLLCTDGLHGVVPDPGILATLKAAPGAVAACQSLTQAALEANSLDNISVACLKLAPRPPGERRITRPNR